MTQIWVPIKHPAPCHKDSRQKKKSQVNHFIQSDHFKLHLFTTTVMSWHYLTTDCPWLSLIAHHWSYMKSGRNTRKFQLPVELKFAIIILDSMKVKYGGIIDKHREFQPLTANVSRRLIFHIDPRFFLTGMERNQSLTWIIASSVSEWSWYLAMRR